MSLETKLEQLSGEINSLKEAVETLTGALAANTDALGGEGGDAGTNQGSSSSGGALPPIVNNEAGTSPATRKQKTRKKTDKKKAKKKTASKPVDPFKDDDDDGTGGEPDVTLDMVRDKAFAYRDSFEDEAEGKNEAKKVITKYAPRLAEIPEDRYAEIYEELCELLEDI